MLRFDSCPNCFGMLDGKKECPHCGYNYEEDKKQPRGVLEPFTVLAGRYLIGKVLGKGGFGVTYVAKDIEDDSVYAVKEYMPSEYSTRSADKINIQPNEDRKARYVFEHGREKFVEEAKTLYALKNNPIVVDIIDYFNENNTAYLVMEYLDGIDLRKLSKQKGGTIDAELAKAVFVTVASALVAVHKKNILHRDLSPENIFITKSHDIKLIDFGAARNYVKTQNKGMSILLKPGFAPPEQYSSKGSQGPWTDVYALCATFYTLVSGKHLIDAMYRYRGESQPTLYELGCDVSKQTSDVIAKGMELELEKRYKNFTELLRDLDVDLEKLNLYSSRTRAEQKEEQQAKEENPEQEPEPEKEEKPAQTPEPEKEEKPEQTPEPEKEEIPEQTPEPEKEEKPEQAPEPEKEEKPEQAPRREEQESPKTPDYTPRHGGESEEGKFYSNGYSPKHEQGTQPPNGGRAQGGVNAGGAWQANPQGGYRQPSPQTDINRAAQNRAFRQNPQANQNIPHNQPVRQMQNQLPRQPLQQQRYVNQPVQQPRQRLGLVANGRIVYSVPVPYDRELKIGRSKECDFIVGGDSNISRVHCTLRFDPSRRAFALTDNSSNGTFFENHTRLKRGVPYTVQTGCAFYLVTPNHRLTIFDVY